jgi:hypothetical protein
MITLVVFSKDRAMQLDSLLRSVGDHCTGIDDVVVIADATSDLHERAYDQLAFDGTLLRQRALDVSLGVALAYALKRAEHVSFAVDDMIFYRPSDFGWAAKELDTEKAFVWSWRLGRRNNCVIDTCDGSFWCGPPGYAWHVDGSLYRTADYARTLERFYPQWREARTPNDLEGTVAMRADEWAPGILHLGPIEPTCMTWQINQAHVTPGVRRAPFTAVSETQLDALAEAYLAGRRVDNERLYADLSWTVRFQKRPGRAHVEACEESAAFYASLIR